MRETSSMMVPKSLPGTTIAQDPVATKLGCIWHATTTVAEQDQACFRILFSILNFHFRLLVSGFRPWVSRDFGTDQRALTMSRPPSCNRARRPRRLCSSLVNDELGYFVRFPYFYLIFLMVPLIHVYHIIMCSHVCMLNDLKT